MTGRYSNGAFGAVADHRWRADRGAGQWRRSSGNPGYSDGVVALMVRHPGLGEEDPARGEGVDAADRLLVPPEVERAVPALRAEEHHVRVGQVVVYPPREGLPRGSRLVAREEPGDDDARRRSHAAVLVPAVPHVAGMVPLRLPAPVALVEPIVAVGVHLDGAERGADRHVPEGGVEGFQQLLAEPRPGRDREVRVVGDVGDPVEVRDLAVEHLAHVEVLRQPDPAERLEGLHGGGLAHGSLLNPTTYEVQIAFMRIPGTQLPGSTTS